MAGLLFMEGFETYGANGDTGSNLQDILKTKYVEVSFNTTAKLSDAAYEGQGLCFDAVTANSSAELALSLTPSSELIVGFAWYSGSLINTSVLYSGKLVQSLIFCQANTNGSFWVWYASGSKTTSTGWFTSNTWYYVELKYKLDDSTGYWELYLDGSLVDSFSGDTVGTQGNTITSHTWKPGNNTGVRFDDIYVYDNTGDVQEPYGPVKIRALVPDGDDTTDWTSTGANHYDQVNNIPVDTANYVESDTANDVDLFTFANATDPDNWPILGIQLNVQAVVTDVGLFTLEGLADSNGTVETSNETIIDDTGGQYTFIFEEDPETSNAWTIDTLNDAKFGVGVE
jgi:hypothetical protein